MARTAAGVGWTGLEEAAAITEIDPLTIGRTAPVNSFFVDDVVSLMKVEGTDW